MQLKFETYHEGKFWCARACGVDIFTQGRTKDELIQNISEAVKLHFEDTRLSPENTECRWSGDVITVNMVFQNHSG